MKKINDVIRNDDIIQNFGASCVLGKDFQLQIVDQAPDVGSAYPLPDNLEVISFQTTSLLERSQNIGLKLPTVQNSKSR